jgi:hypothetical protein
LQEEEIKTSKKYDRNWKERFSGRENEKVVERKLVASMVKWYTIINGKGKKK